MAKGFPRLEREGGGRNAGRGRRQERWQPDVRKMDREKQNEIEAALRRYPRQRRLAQIQESQIAEFTIQRRAIPGLQGLDRSRESLAYIKPTPVAEVAGDPDRRLYASCKSNAIPIFFFFAARQTNMDPHFQRHLEISNQNCAAARTIKQRRPRLPLFLNTHTPSPRTYILRRRTLCIAQRAHPSNRCYPAWGRMVTLARGEYGSFP